MLSACEASAKEKLIRIGTEKGKKEVKTLFVKNGADCSVGDIAKFLPLHLLNKTSLELLRGGPSCRRAFLDSGMFHVEHSFLQKCQQFKRSLLQRNAILKGNGSFSQKERHLEAWNSHFCKNSLTLTEKRKEFLFGFTANFEKIVKELDFCKEFSFKYKQGWGEENLLEEALKDSLQVDLLSGSTNRGPHRAELEVFVNGSLAKNTLSRGQQKTIICAIIFSKSHIFTRKKQTK